LRALLEARDPLYREIADIVVADERPPRRCSIFSSACSSCRPVNPTILGHQRRGLNVIARSARRSPRPSTLWGYMQTLKVDLGERSYPIYIGEGLLDQPELLAPHIAGRQVAIVSNETVAPLYLERLSKTLGAYSVYCQWCCPMAKPTRTGKPCN
jgi:hypothetical protein